MAEADDPHFDRRTSDVNVAALATRMNSLEERVEVLEEKAEANNRELRANTHLTKQLHEAVFGRGDDEDEGIRGKVNEMHAVYGEARSGLRMLNTIADSATRWGKPVVYL